MIDQALAGAEDLTEKLRGSPRLVTRGRCAYLLPTIISCDREHPLANREFLFPFASVIECPTAEIPDAIGSYAGRHRHHQRRKISSAPSWPERTSIA